jgi:hypothetical protein
MSQDLSFPYCHQDLWDCHDSRPCSGASLCDTRDSFFDRFVHLILLYFLKNESPEVVDLHLIQWILPVTHLQPDRAFQLHAVSWCTSH